MRKSQTTSNKCTIIDQNWLGHIPTIPSGSSTPLYSENVKLLQVDSNLKLKSKREKNIRLKDKMLQNTLLSYLSSPFPPFLFFHLLPVLSDIFQKPYMYRQSSTYAVFCDCQNRVSRKCCY